MCTITRIYDQSGHHNDLGVGPIGGNGGPDAGAIANALPVKIGGHSVYGVYVQAGVGYRNDVTNGVATGSQPQGAYMVTSGTHVDGVCCFDFGNAETSGTDTGNGHMDAINFGTECWFTPCTGSGPWVQADLENGLFAGGNGSDTGNKGNSSPFVTAIVNNNGTNSYAIKDANAQSGGVTTEYSGPLPDIGGYTPMHQEGAVILGTGGDNSNGSDGSFFEGVLTAGYPSAATDNAVQANIVAVGYQQVSSGFPVTGTAYTISNVNSGTDVQPDGCGTANGTGIVLWSASGTSCQQWTVHQCGQRPLHDHQCEQRHGARLGELRDLRRHAHRSVVPARQRLPGMGCHRGGQPLHHQQRRQWHGPGRGGLRNRQWDSGPPVGPARQHVPAMGHQALTGSAADHGPPGAVRCLAADSSGRTG